jgi:hypothetical protein
MEYYQGSLYIWGDEDSYKMPLYKYDLDTKEWITILSLGEEVSFPGDYGLCVYKDNFFVIIGSRDSKSSIYKIDPASGNYETYEFSIQKSNFARYGFSYTCEGNYFHLYGGVNDKGILNTLSVIDMDKVPLEFTILSKHISTPTPRSNHGMEVYDNSLYMFGGVSNMGNQY